MKVFGLAGWSGSGKTTLLEDLIPRLTAAGLRVSLIKHAHHRFDIDQPGKDSYRLREAGCSEVLLISEQRWVLMHELRGEAEPSLEDQIARFSECDLVLVEGFKQTPIPKLEVHRPSVGKPLIAGGGVETIVAIATDEPDVVRQQTGLPAGLPILDLNDRGAIADFILRHMGFKHA
jgi:molybdopterin-guanine dinucleotide biosynthesis protein B